MSRVSLVNPQIAMASWNSPFGTMDSTSIRLGLAYLSACLKEAGHEAKLIDLRLLKGWEFPGYFILCYQISLGHFTGGQSAEKRKLDDL